MDQTSAVEAFFHEFEAHSNSGDVASSVSQFADPFLSADPSGSRVVPVAALAMAIPRRKQLFDTIGRRSTSLASLEQTRLDDHHVLAKTVWRIRFDRPEGPVDITAPSTYVVRTSESPFKILFYLNHEDIMAVLRDRGLLPATTSTP
jgi:hypothetical protein